MEPTLPSSDNNNVQFNVPTIPEDTYVPPSKISQPESGNTGSPYSKLIYVVIVLIALIGAFYFYSTFKSAPPPRPTISGLEVATKTALFLDKNFYEDGSVGGGFLCDDSFPEKCVARELNEEQPHVGQAIFSYFMLAEVTGNISYKAKSDMAMDFVLNECQENLRMCEWNFFPLAQYYEKTGNEKYLTQGMLPVAEDFLTRSNEAIVSGNIGHKLASLYKATGDERFRNRLIEIAGEELSTSLGSGSGEFARDVQVAWSIYLQAYNITMDRRYLAAAEELFDNYDIRDHLEDFRTSDLVAVGIKAGDTLLSLSQLSNKGSIYKEQAKVLLQYYMDNLWDTPDNLKYNGDYGFIDNAANEFQDYKYTLFNGWLIKLFVIMKDTKFEI